MAAVRCLLRGGGGGSVPAPPDGGSGLGSGVAAAGGVYEQSQAGVSGLDADSGRQPGLVVRWLIRAALVRG